MKKFLVCMCVVAVALLMAAPAMAVSAKGNDAIWSDAEVKSIRNVLTAEGYDPNSPVYVLYHKNAWGKNGPQGPFMVEVTKSADGWVAKDMAGIIHNIGQFSQKPAASAGPFDPDNIKWPALQKGGPGVIVFDGNLCAKVPQ